MRPAKTQIDLHICPIWSEFSLSTWRSYRSLAILRAHSKDSDQTGLMPRLIWVLAGCKGHFVCFVVLWLITLKYQRYVPRPLIPIIRSYLFIGVCRVPVRLMALALFTRISIPPNLSTADWTAFSTWSSCCMSTTHGRHLPPTSSTGDSKRNKNDLQFWFNRHSDCL